MNRKLSNVMVTGGAGFIGSNFIRFLLSQPDFRGRIINVDALTYAGNLENLADVDGEHRGRRYFFEKADICDGARMASILESYEIDTIVHFAAESHVDRSISGPAAFVQTNVLGTFALLEAARQAWRGREDVLFHQVGTDEVYGSLGGSGYFTEETPYDPRSPYSASKAAADHFVMAYFHTYGVPVTLSNCSNNYGPYQNPEKLIPLMITNMLAGKPLPVYGDGKNVRDWIYVDDHNAAVWLILRNGKTGESYNIGGENEWENIRLVKSLCGIVADLTGETAERYERLISFVEDRLGHDRRYAIDCSKIKRDLLWSQARSFEDGLRATAGWYLKRAEATTAANG